MGHESNGERRDKYELTAQEKQMKQESNVRSKRELEASLSYRHI